MKKAYLLMVGLFLMPVLLFGQPAEKLFFEDWPGKSILIRPDGYLQIIKSNPEQTAEIKAVLLIIDPSTDIIRAFFFWGPDGTPQIYVLEEGKYSKKISQACFKCHKRNI